MFELLFVINDMLICKFFIVKFIVSLKSLDKFKYFTMRERERERERDPIKV